MLLYQPLLKWSHIPNLFPGKVTQLFDESLEDEPVADIELQKTCDMKMLVEKMEKMEAQLKEL